MSRSRFTASLVLLVALPMTALAATEEKRSKYAGTLIEDAWNVRVGVCAASFDTQASFSPQGPVGAIIRLEDDLGLESNLDTGFIGFAHRFNERHRIVASYVNLDRTASRSIQRDIELPSGTYRIGARVATELDTTMFRVNWAYNVASGDRLLAGFGVGLSTFRIRLALSGEAEVDDGQGGTRIEGVQQAETVIAPVPLIGMFIDYAIKPRLIVRASVEAIDLSVGSQSGRVLESSFAAEYYVTRVVGLGAGLGNTDIEYTQNAEGDAIDVTYRIPTLNFYLSFTF